jgi:hypothetical protein
VTHDQQDLLRSRPLSEMTDQEVAELFRLLQPESRGQHSGGPGARASAGDVTDELALKLTILEAELRGLRQALTEVKANPNEPRQEMGESRRGGRMAERTGPTPTEVKRRAWFCGRAAASN